KAEAQPMMVAPRASIVTGSNLRSTGAEIVFTDMSVPLPLRKIGDPELLDNRQDRWRAVIMAHTSDLLPLDTLRAFEAAARTGSFSAAAEALSVTHGAVSRQIAKLERWLGQRLFERQARGV